MIRLLKRLVGALTPTKKNRKSTVFVGPDKPENMKKGDIWFQTKGSHLQSFRQF